jgi:mono/diheme cytochrome c family protein
MRPPSPAALFLLLLLASPAAAADPQDSSQITRGRYLATVGDCIGCHTAPGGADYAGGLPIKTPFGAIISPNLTPDADTGIGRMSDDDFIAALQNGRSFDGQRLYPAMPYVYYTKVKRDDILAIRAFLRTLPAVSHKVVANQLPFPLNIRAVMAGWNLLFFDAGRFTPVAGKSEQWNQGAHLVQGLGHCAACHTAKNALGGDDTKRTLQGGVLQGWYSANLTGDQRTGLGSWSPAEIKAYLKTGHNRTAAATGPMAEVISRSTSHMNDDDLTAIAVFLRDQAGQSDQPPTAIAANTTIMEDGRAVYRDNCAACHTAAGDGVAGLFPALKGSPTVQSADPTTLIRVILQGTQSVATDAAPTGAMMPSLAWKLSDGQVAAVVTYIRNEWGNAAKAAEPGHVHDLRTSLATAP